METKPLFLKWALSNVMFVIAIVTLVALGFAHGLHQAPLFVTVAIVGITGVFSAYGGLLAWRTDDALAWKPKTFGKARADILKGIAHDLDHLFHAIWVCQILGIVGALMGYREEAAAAATNGDPTAAIHAVFAGLGNGLTATLTGVLCSLLFFAQHRLLDHRVARELRESDV
jgi:hypothetical protein